MIDDNFHTADEIHKKVSVLDANRDLIEIKREIDQLSQHQLVHLDAYLKNRIKRNSSSHWERLDKIWESIDEGDCISLKDFKGVIQFLRNSGV